MHRDCLPSRRLHPCCRILRAAGLWGGACLSGCTVGPDYRPPSLQMPDAWHQEVTGELAGGQPEMRHWWESFGDPGLDRVVTEVADHNHSLAAALQRVVAARALRSGTAAAGLPHLGAAGRLDWFRNSGNGLQASFGSQGAQNENEVVLQANVSWEIDVFGRVRRRVEAADAELAAQVEDYHDLLVVLRADAAQAYVDLRSAQERLRLVRANAELQRNTLRLAQGRVDSGLAPAADVASAEQNLASTEALVPGLERALRGAENRLGVLLAASPAHVRELVGDGSEVPAAPARLPVGVPADLLRQRPDLRAAERRLAAEVARIGVATADLYPSFSLNGFLGYDSLDSTKTITSKSRTHDLAPGFSWRLFEFGAVRSEISAQEATAAAAQADYEQTVTAAIGETEDTLTGIVQEQLHAAALAAALAAARRATGLQRALYTDGLVDFQSVLDAERSQLGIEDQTAQSRAELARLAIQLYRVLGGGVPPPAGTPEARP
jgi:outer membrane protein, multidrug efflux system